MSQIVPIFIPGPTQLKETPECPHCGKKLKGWSEPNEYPLSGRETLLVIWTFLQICAFLAGLLIQGINGKGYDHTWKRWDYVFPAYYVGYKIGAFMGDDK